MSSWHWHGQLSLVRSCIKTNLAVFLRVSNKIGKHIWTIFWVSNQKNDSLNKVIHGFGFKGLIPVVVSLKKWITPKQVDRQLIWGRCMGSFSFCCCYKNWLLPFILSRWKSNKVDIFICDLKKEFSETIWIFI